MSRVHNAPAALQAKVRMRLNVLEHVTPARVLDCYCGPVGEMYAGAWQRAAGYMGVDRDYVFPDQGRRYVADTCLVLRSIDLASFNVFDVDAFGSPWEAADIIASRRRWAMGERGAIVLTDGGSLKSRWGDAPRAAARLAKMRTTKIAPTVASGRIVSDAALRGWLTASNVKPLRRWDAEGNGSGLGGSLMLYTAIVFEGI